ncbi:MAG: hypothetical protein K0R80_494 [Clostridia bacterium]|nr:hypothetical protein [Clostridia bacterium]
MMTDKYQNTKTTDYSEFVSIVEDIGFMTLSNNCIDFTNLSGLTMEEQWHTDLPSDPWQWRVNIEKDHKAAYGKLFDKKPGFISLEWYPIFLASRRKGRSFAEIYSEGLISNYAKQIYDLFKHHKTFGWPSTAYSTVETWAGDQLIEEAMGIKPEDAMDDIIMRVQDIIPNGEMKKIRRFIGIY